MRIFDGEVNNVTNKTIGTVPNAPLASAPGKELHPPILGMLDIHGCQVKRDTVLPELFKQRFYG